MRAPTLAPPKERDAQPSDEFKQRDACRSCAAIPDVAGRDFGNASGEPDIAIVLASEDPRRSTRGAETTRAPDARPRGALDAASAPAPPPPARSSWSSPTPRGPRGSASPPQQIARDRASPPSATSTPTSPKFNDGEPPDPDPRAPAEAARATSASSAHLQRADAGRARSVPLAAVARSRFEAGPARSSATTASAAIVGAGRPATASRSARRCEQVNALPSMKNAADRRAGDRSDRRRRGHARAVRRLPAGAGAPASLLIYRGAGAAVQRASSSR